MKSVDAVRARRLGAPRRPAAPDAVELRPPETLVGQATVASAMPDAQAFRPARQGGTPKMPVLHLEVDGVHLRTPAVP
ncbi:hypothetical protein [Sinomonas flava]|uniref:hypothetical protein n=1 Tax=Sinomonas flava TaxID=496857 RepID=UPI0039A7302D